MNKKPGKGLGSLTKRARRVVILSIMLSLLSACGGAGRGIVDEASGSTRQLDGGLPTDNGGVPLRGETVEGEWRTFRGALHRSGTRLAPGITEPRVVWSAQVGIQGYTNTPLLGDGMVFMTSQGATHNQSDPTDGFYAIDAETGQEIWFTATNEDINGGALSDNLVLGGADDGTVYALDRETGEIVWQYENGNSVFHGPTVVSDEVYLTADEEVVVIDVHTGTELRRIARLSDAYLWRGHFAADDEGRIFLTAERGAIEALEQWETRANDSSSYDSYASGQTYAPPMVIGDRVVALLSHALGWDELSLTLSVMEADSGEFVWTVDSERQAEGAPNAPSWSDGVYYYASLPWLMNGYLYYPQASTHELVGVSFATGEIERYLSFSDCRNRVFSSIVGVPSRGYYARHDGYLYAFSPPDGTVQWRFYLGRHDHVGTTVSTSGATGMGGYYGHAYDYGYDDNSYCRADPYDGTALFATPAIGEDGDLYVGSGDGWLYRISDAR